MHKPPDFITAFQMDVFHQYLAGKAYAAVSVHPVGSTQRALDRFGLLAAQAGNRFSLYADTVRLRSLMQPDVRPAFAATGLVFSMKFHDPHFAQYTELPLSEDGTLVFTEQPLAAGRQNPRLTEQPLVSSDDLYLTYIGPFEIRVPTSATSAPYRVVDVDDREVASPAPKQGRLTINGELLTTGCYRVRWGKQRICQFFVGDRFRLSSSGAIIYICGEKVLGCLDALTATRTGLPMDAPSLPPVSTLTFASRATVWRYDVFNHGGADPADFTIAPVLDTPWLDFSRVPGIAGPGGEMSIAFESDDREPILLQARPVRAFRLMRNGRAIIDPLPTPGPVFGGRTAGRTLRSDMFVHL